MRAAPFLLILSAVIVALMGVAASGPDFSFDAGQPAMAEQRCQATPLPDDGPASETALPPGSLPGCRAVLRN
jgi:hypothetical protein